MLREQMDALIKQSMLDKNVKRTEVLRAIKNEFLVYQTAKNAKPYDEAAEIQLISKMCKKLEDSISSFIEAGREDLATEYRDELEVLKKLLPEPVNEPDIHSALQIWCEGKGFIEDFYNEENSIDMVSFQIPKKEMGNAIKYLKSEFPQADGKMISEIVKKYIV